MYYASPLITACRFFIEVLLLPTDNCSQEVRQSVSAVSGVSAFSSTLLFCFVLLFSSLLFSSLLFSSLFSLSLLLFLFLFLSLSLSLSFSCTFDQCYRWPKGRARVYLKPESPTTQHQLRDGVLKDEVATRLNSTNGHQQSAKVVRACQLTDKASQRQAQTQQGRNYSVPELLDYCYICY